MYVAVLSLSLLFVASSPAVECKETTKADIMASSDIGSTSELDRISNPKPLQDSVRKPSTNSSAEPLDEQRKPDEKMKDEQKQHPAEKGESSDLINIDDNNSGNVADEAPKKANSHETESRSNSSSSSAESVENTSSRHPLFADRHQEEKASGAAVSLDSDSNSSPETAVAHEHVERYQLHQSSEEDSIEDSGFKAPASGSAHGKVPDSVVVHSGVLPVQPVFGNKILGNSNINNESGAGRIVTFRKPIPIVRQEAV